MKAEQTTFSKFWLSPQSGTVEVQITICFELTAEAGPSVSTKLSYEPKFPEAWQAQDEIHQKLYNGVHGGLASVELTLPETCLEFDIAHLSVSPPLQEMTGEDVQRIGNLLQELVRWTVASLWSESHKLNTSNLGD